MRLTIQTNEHDERTISWDELRTQLGEEMYDDEDIMNVYNILVNTGHYRLGGGAQPIFYIEVIE